MIIIMYLIKKKINETILCIQCVFIRSYIENLRISSQEIRNCYGSDLQIDKNVKIILIQ